MIIVAAAHSASAADNMLAFFCWVKEARGDDRLPGEPVEVAYLLPRNLKAGGASLKAHAPNLPFTSATRRLIEKPISLSEFLTTEPLTKFPNAGCTGPKKPRKLTLVLRQAF